MADPVIERMRRDVDAYSETVERIEPDIHPIDASAYYASAAISLKRSADALERLERYGWWIVWACLLGIFLCAATLLYVLYR